MVTAFIFLLRMVRAICGLYIIVFSFGLVLLVAGAAVFPVHLLAASAILLGLMGLLLSVFFGLRWLVNRVYKWKYGGAHPVLGHRRWAL
ncbi:MAG: hypothetical protein EOO23_04725 [Comamonadaceae bacterium]|nr:MAG: hypothetical protein EOO23_04725 [Comamonadaceae bacterium]